MTKVFCNRASALAASTVHSALKYTTHRYTMRTVLSVASVALMAVAIPVRAGIAVLNFEDQSVAAGTTTILSSAFNSNGYHFASTYGGSTFNSHFHFSHDAGGLAANGTTWLLVHDNLQGATNALILTEVGGGAFTLGSAEFAEAYATGSPNALAGFNATSIDVVGYVSTTATLFRTIVLDGINDSIGGLRDFQTETFNWSGLSRVEFRGAGGGLDSAWGVDQVVGVPEPGGLALMGLALIGVAGTRRKTRRSVNWASLGGGTCASP